MSPLKAIASLVLWSRIISLVSLQQSMAAEAFLIQSGTSCSEIVVSETPARMTKLAAKELQTSLDKISGVKVSIVTRPTDGRMHMFVGKSSYTSKLNLTTDGLENGAFRMASGTDWIALLEPDEDFVPIEPWGRIRTVSEQSRVNLEFDKITGDTFWNHFGYIYTRYHRDLDVWDYDDAGTLNAVYEFLRSLGMRRFTFYTDHTGLG